MRGRILGTALALALIATAAWAAGVIEGKVTVRTENGDLIAGPLDSIWLPKGTELRYESDSALVFYAIHPSNWAEASP